MDVSHSLEHPGAARAPPAPLPLPPPAPLPKPQSEADSCGSVHKQVHPVLLGLYCSPPIVTKYP